MIPLETMAAFFLASVLLALAPGPDNIFVLTQSALNGKLPGLLVTLGLCTGLVVHTTAVVFGIAVIFQVSVAAFTALKTIGACYLIYLAWQAFNASATELRADHNAGVKPGKLYRRGIIMNVTNPKVSIFFLAFLPQFADPGSGPLPVQLFILGVIFILATVLVFGSIALLAGALGQWLNKSGKAQIILNRVAGTVFIGLALKLVMIKR